MYSIYSVHHITHSLTANVLLFMTHSHTHTRTHAQGFGTQTGEYGSAGGRRTVAYLEASQLHYDDDTQKEFRIVLAAEYTREVQRVAPNWLRLDASVSEAMFVVRETFGDRTKELPMSVSIQCVGERHDALTAQSVVPSQLTAEQLCNALHSTTLLVAGATTMFAKWARDFQYHTNTLPLFDQQRSDQAGGDPNIRYFHSYWSIPPHTALVVRITPPDPCQSWNFQLNNHWMESLDYRYHRVHTNSALATRDEMSEKGSSGQPSFTLVIAHEGEERSRRKDLNWLSTTGHSCGTM
jgi:hypothetical protein